MAIAERDADERRQPSQQQSTRDDHGRANSASHAPALPRHNQFATEAARTIFGTTTRRSPKMLKRLSYVAFALIFATQLVPAASAEQIYIYDRPGFIGDDYEATFDV